MKLPNPLIRRLTASLWICFHLWALPERSFANSVTIDTSDYRSSDITVQPAIPWENGETVVQVKCINRSSADAADISIVLKEAGDQEIIDHTTVSAKPGDTAIARLKWRPKTNGWRKLKVEVDQNGAKTSTEIIVPVVARPLSFVWFGGSLERDKDLRYATILQAHTAEPGVTLKWLKYWEDRGVRACQWKGFLKEKTAQEYQEYLALGIDPQLHPRAKSIWIDEMGGYSDNELPFPDQLKALQKYTETNPDTWTGLWICGALRPSFCTLAKNIYRKTGVDLLLLEAYTNFKTTEFKSYNPYAYFDHDLSVARSQDVLSNVILVLGIGDIKTAGYTVTTASLEDQVRYIRANAPEIAGVGFFKSDEPEAIVKFSDELCRKYWIDPLVTIWERDILFSNFFPKGGEDVKISVSIFNIGGMDAKDIQVAFYDNDPRAGGKLIGDVHQIDLITPTQGCPDGRVEITQSWRAVKGDHNIFVAISSEKGGVSILNATGSKFLHVQ